MDRPAWIANVLCGGLPIAQTVLVTFGPHLTPALLADFNPGHVYLAVRPAEPCDLGGIEYIQSFDPKSGEVEIFADSDDGICRASGLTFTSDGNFLRVVNYGSIFNNGFVQEFDSAGVGTVILDESDGINMPHGRNTAAFAENGDYYLMNTFGLNILRFPADGGPAEVFVRDEQVNTVGSLAFAPSGNLYCVSEIVLDVMVVAPDGAVSEFDTLPEYPALSIAIDRSGNIFVTDAKTIYRYDHEDASTRRILSVPDNSVQALALSPDETQLYSAELESIPPGYDIIRLYAIDLRSEIRTSWLGESGLGNSVRGIAVYPCPTDDPQQDCNFNDILDSCETDCNANGIPDECDFDNGTVNDCNSNSVPDECETDCNQNGLPDTCDLEDGTSIDCNANQIPDECDTDCNENGFPDSCDLEDGTSEDCNANKVPDECEEGPDCDGNNRPDECDIEDGAADLNEDGIPDVCQCHADVNFDGVVDPLDLGAVMARFSVEPDGELAVLDVNFDGVIDPLDAGYVLSRFGICP